MRPVRRTALILSLVLLACGSETSPEQAFCDQAVSILQREEIGDDPRAMREQMEELAIAVEALPEDRQPRLSEMIGDLIEQLQSAERGELAISGWSSTNVVDHVGELCDRDDLIGWVTQS